MIYFDQCEVSIAGTGIMANQVSLSNSNSLTPIKVIGKRGVLTQTLANDITYNLQISYYLETDNEPNFAIVQEIKDFFSKDEIYTPKTVVVGGITGQYYLNKYSIKATPNNVLNATVEYLGFGGVSGNFIEKNNSVVYNKSNGEQLGLYVFITSTGNFTANKSLSFDYSFSADWQPIYTIGQRQVKEVKLLSASEDITIERENYHNLTFSGDAAAGALFNSSENETIKIYGIKFTCDRSVANAKEIILSGFRVKQSDVSFSTDSFLLSKVSFSKFY